MDKRLINLTSSRLYFRDSFGFNIIVEASGGVARLYERSVIVGYVKGIPIYRREYGHVIGLPEPCRDTLYIVSEAVAREARLRDDVLCVGDPIIDDDGRIIGYRSLNMINGY